MAGVVVSGAGMLAASMERVGMTNEALARLLDVRPSMVSMMRNGRMDIPVCRIAQISAALGIRSSVLADACIESYPRSGTWQAYALGRADAESRRAA